MKISIYSICSLFVLSSSLFAQSPDWEVVTRFGKQVEVDKSYSPNRVIAANGSRIIHYSKVNTNGDWSDEQTVELYDESLNLLGTVAPSLGNYKFGDHFYYNLACTDQLCFEFGKVERPLKKVAEFATVSVDLKTMSTDNKLVPYTEVDYIEKALAIYEGELFVSTSTHARRMATLEVPLRSSGQNIGLVVRVLKESGVVDWESEITLDKTAEQMTPRMFKVLDDGRIIICSRLTSEVGKLGFLTQAGFNVMMIDAKGSRVDMNVMVKDWVVSYGQPTINTSGNLVFAGFLSKDLGAFATGWFYQEMNLSSGQIVHQSHGAFDIDFILQGVSGSQAKRTQKSFDKGEEYGIEEFAMKKILPFDDGSVAICGETYSIETAESTIYKHGDLVCLKINQDGTVAWQRKLTKAQKSKDDGGRYSSAIFSSVKNHLFIVLNDEVENISNINGEAKQCNIKEGKLVSMAARIDPVGNVEKKIIFEQDDFDLCIGDNNWSDGTLFLFRTSKKLLQPVQIDFKL